MHYAEFKNGVSEVRIASGSRDEDIATSYVQHVCVLNGKWPYIGFNHKEIIEFKKGSNAMQLAGFNSDGVLKIWTPADLVN